MAPDGACSFGYSCVLVSAVNYLSSPLDGRSSLSSSLSSYGWAGWLPNRRHTACWCCGRVARRMGIGRRSGRGRGRAQTLKLMQTVIDIQQLLYNHLLRRPATAFANTQSGRGPVHAAPCYQQDAASIPSHDTHSGASLISLSEYRTHSL